MINFLLFLKMSAKIIQFFLFKPNIWEVFYFVGFIVPYLSHLKSVTFFNFDKVNLE